MRVVGTERHLGDIHVAVGCRDEAEVLLAGPLAADGELRDGCPRRRLRRLPAGVGVSLGVEDKHIDVAPGGEHVVEAAEADVVRPAVAADDPHALRDEVVDEGVQPGAVVDAPQPAS